MFFLELLFIFIIGLVVGSFLNVLIYRSKEDKLSTIFFSRSYCPKCKHLLAWYDLVPLFSFLSLKGKCRYCQATISSQYPIVELINALLYIILFLFFGLSLSFGFYAIVFSILLAVAVHDIQTQYTPEILVWVALGLAIVGILLVGKVNIISLLIGAAIGAGVPGFLVLVSKEKWMGAGDIKIGLILGLILGYPLAILGLFLAFLIGAFVGIIYVKVRGGDLKDSLPFAPFLILSTFFALLYGQKIIDWYLSSFLFF